MWCDSSSTMVRSRWQEASIRIAFVHSFYSSAQPSGENRAVESEARALAGAGHEVRLIPARTDDLERTPFYPVTSALRVATGIGRSPLGALRAFGPDVVHVHNLFPNFGTRWAGSVDVPIVATLHNFRPLCANGLLYRDGAVCTLCPDGDRTAGIRYGCYRGSRLASLPLGLANRSGPQGNPLLRRADRVIVLSQTAREIYLAAGLPERKVVVWGNFLPDELDPGRDVGEPMDARWLYVGRLSSEKGIALLVEAWPSDVPLTVVGDGVDRPRIEAGARGKRIELRPLLERSEVIDLMRRSLGLVFPSRCLESFPLVYAEAMAAGLPVLAWEPNVVAGMTRLDGTGMAISWRDDLPSALRAAASSFPRLRERCRRVFEERMSERAHVVRAEGLYRDLVG